jgi:hypothetical protein
VSGDGERQVESVARTGRTAISVGLVVLVVLIVDVFLSYQIRERRISRQYACIGNLRLIESGKEQAAMAYRLTDGDAIASTSVQEYWKGGAAPICPEGGTYTYGKIGERPQCSIEAPTSHNLP